MLVEKYKELVLKKEFISKIWISTLPLQIAYDVLCSSELWIRIVYGLLVDR